MEDLWFEEELIPSDITVEQTVKSITSGDRNKEPEINDQIRNTVRGYVYVNRPRWSELNATAHGLLTSGQDSRFYLVRLGFQFIVPQEAREQGYNFVSANCEARLRPAEKNQPQPTVYSVIPSDLYEGEMRRVSVKLGPKIQLGVAEVSIGEVSTDFTIGIVEPEIIGWTGKDERAPRWELRPHSKKLLGERHLWLVIESPKGCSGVQLAVRSQGIRETRLFGLITVAPKAYEWDTRPSILIE